MSEVNLFVLLKVKLVQTSKFFRLERKFMCFEKFWTAVATEEPSWVITCWTATLPPQPTTSVTAAIGNGRKMWASSAWRSTFPPSSLIRQSWKSSMGPPKGNTQSAWDRQGLYETPLFDSGLTFYQNFRSHLSTKPVRDNQNMAHILAVITF